MECSVWDAQGGVEHEVYNAAWSESLECRVWSVECRVRDVECGV